MKHFVRYAILLLTIVAATGCQDDFAEQEIIGKGQSTVYVTLDFKPMSSALTRTSGDALKEIESLHVLLYDDKGNIKEKWQIAEYDVSDEKRTNADAENGIKAENQTKRATFKLPEEIEFGRYYMYAVANIPDLLTTYENNIATVDGLKSIPLTWNPQDIAANGQMMGCFTNVSGNSTGGELLVVKEKSVKLHAWLRRAASKVTIAYDGSDLKEGVFVYLESVQIKDIPSQCYLGKENNVGAEGYTLKAPQKGKETDMEDGETIIYSEHNHGAADFDIAENCMGHRITAGTPKFGSHGETDNALYFYENMQGAGDDMPDKRQDATGPDGKPDGKLDFPGLPDDETYRLKDDVLYGTYIEVTAHYISNNSERLGNGRIIYRFMLGQNVTNDYNAKRNCHYKLTLKFKNFANEADWHIEYEEPEPGVMTPEPYYITYLYNHSMMYPIKVNTGGHEIESIRAEIIENNWAPHNATPGKGDDTAPGDYYAPAAKGTEKLWNGFLSLHQTTETILGTDNDKADSEDVNKSKYEEKPKRGVRIYTDFTEGEHATTSDEAGESRETDKYRVEKHPTEVNTYNVFIPMYTRAKLMYKTTGYTGNNPYVAYQRKAVVRITTKLKDVEKLFINEVPIYQVRRVVNPKGIYRSSGKNTSFHVVLKRLPGEDATKFIPFQSEGPWKAYVVRQTNGEGITLSETSGSEERPDSVYGTAIHGKTGSVIDFNVDFSGSSTENRYAIIRVEYHNYTCQHLIFVRQGDKPDNLIDNGTKWYAYNMTAYGKPASTPLEEGSLFKFANWKEPIDALSNKTPFSPWINVTKDSFVKPEDLSIVGEDQPMSWETIGSGKTTDTFGDTGISGTRVAEDADFMALKNDTVIEEGYGVLYGDDATETADSIGEAYGYDYANNNNGRGMRGCFVYNRQTGKNLFFPIGASGYGRRKQTYTQSWGDPETINGVLRYCSGRTKLFPTPINLPLFYDLYKRPGAVYWYDKTIKKGSADYLGWDINYFTFDFNNLGADNLVKTNGSDACFIRCVVDE